MSLINFFNSSHKKLEIGPGSKKISEDWTTVGDFSRTGVVDEVCEWGKQELPFKNNTFDYVYSSHSLEHVFWYDVDYALQEVYRILKTGGVFEVHVPDLHFLIDCYLKNKNGDNWNKFDNQEHSVKWFSSRIFSYGPTLSNYHKSSFDENYLTFCLKKAKFKKIKKIDNSLAHVLHGQINLGLMGEK